MAEIVDRLLRLIGGVPKKDHAADVKRAYETGFGDGNDDPQSGDIAAGGFGYRGGGSMGRESGVTLEKNIATAWALWQSNGLAQRIIELKRDYIAGGGVTYRASDDELQEIIDEFVKINKLEDRAAEFALQLYLFGVQCYPVFVRESDGRVILGYIDPEHIQPPVIAHPENAMEMWAVVTKIRTSSLPWVKSETKPRIYRIIRQETKLEDWEHVMLDHYGLTEYSGNCFYYKVNAMSNQTTGQSDLLANADYLDQWDQTLFALGEREQFADFFALVLELQGASAAEILAKSREVSSKPPKRGSILTVNEKQRWDVFSPDLKQQASVATVEAQRKNIIGTSGYPEAWFGAASGTGLATIQAQGDPTWRSLKHSQDIIKHMLQDFVDYARDQALLAGAYRPGSEVGTIDVIMPEMTARDLVALSSALTGVTSALMIWVDNGWVTAVDVKAVLDKITAEIGIELDPEHVPDVTPSAPVAFDGAPLFEQAQSARDWRLAHRPLVSEDT